MDNQILNNDDRKYEAELMYQNQILSNHAEELVPHNSHCSFIWPCDFSIYLSSVKILNDCSCWVRDRALTCCVFLKQLMGICLSLLCIFKRSTRFTLCHPKYLNPLSFSIYQETRYHWWLAKITVPVIDFCRRKLSFPLWSSLYDFKAR